KDGPGPIVDFSSALVSGGNGNGAIERNECNDLFIVVQNNGSQTASNVTATLSTVTADTLIDQAAASFGNIPPGALAPNASPFRLSTLATFPCGLPISLSLAFNYDGGSDVSGFTVPTTAAPSTRYDQNTAMAIPDLSTNISTNVVAGFAGAVTKATVSLQLNH